MIKVAFFDTHQFERAVFEKMNIKTKFDIHFFEPRLTEKTATLASGFQILCSFVNDHIDAKTLKVLKDQGTKLIACRSAGYNHIDIRAATRLGITVMRVPEYSPFAVAEHAVALLLALNRKIPRAYNRVKDLNFSLEGLVGFDLHGKTIGIIGTGRIGTVFAQILSGFGTKILAHDHNINPNLVSKYGVQYVDLEAIYKKSDVISLHIPLTPKTKHLIDSAALKKMKESVILVNTSRGALIDAKALLQALKKNKIGGAALDVYEEEEGIFFSDLSSRGIQDDLLAELLTFPNVLITSHQAFLTTEALNNIANTTLNNITDFLKKKKSANIVV